MVRLALLKILRLLHEPDVVITGWLVGDEGMVTSVAAVGTFPPHQLLPVFQSVPVLPNHIRLVEEQSSSPTQKSLNEVKPEAVIVFPEAAPLVVNQVVAFSLRILSKEVVGLPTLSFSANVKLEL
jgi:hypothetical protein